MPTGFVGGMCISLGRAEDPMRYTSGEPLPQSSCVEGSVAIPTEPGLGDGDFAVCFPVGVVDADCCRDGYRCERTGFGVTSMTGFCQPVR